MMSRSIARRISSRAGGSACRSTRVVRLVGQTKGGIVFLTGKCEQDGEPTHSFTGTLKRMKAARMTGPVAEAYAALVAAGELKPDPDQSARSPRWTGSPPARESSRGLLGRLLGKAATRRAASICGAGSGAASRC